MSLVRRIYLWAILVCILLIYVVAIVRLHPTNFFGLTGDDAIYLSSGQAIAQGRGYILPSLPGTPPATKYPILYPWVLSWVWHWNSEFPANLRAALGITVVFGGVFLIFAFLFTRRLKGIGDTEALLLTAFCALQPAFLFYSGNVLSDVPFAAFALGALCVADQAMQPSAGNARAIFCGFLAGISMLLRVFGVPVAAGIIVAGLIRRAWRQTWIFSLLLVPFFIALIWRVIFPTLPSPPVTGAAASSLGWVRMWTYYTSYIGAWRLAVPNIHVFAMMVKNNLGALLRGPGAYFVDPLFAHHFKAGPIIAILVAAAVVASTIRQFRNQTWRPAYMALPFYALVVIAWNYADAVRFFLPFLPLFAADLWLEAKYLAAQVRNNVAADSIVKKSSGVALALLVLTSGCTVAWGYKDGMRRGIWFESLDRGALLRAKQGAYAWLLASTSPGVRVIACEDGPVYLYTHRASISPFTFSTEELYNPRVTDETVAHLTDVATAIRADYWIFADDDMNFWWSDRPPSVDHRMREIEKALPLVYRSSDGRVRMYSLACIQHPEISSCGSAVPTLFPVRGIRTSEGAGGVAKLQVAGR